LPSGTGPTIGRPLVKGGRGASGPESRCGRSIVMTSFGQDALAV
jgi:hypothetical protein